MIIPEQSDGLHNGDVVDIVRKRARRASARVSKSRKPRKTAKQRLEDFMSGFGGLKDKAEWKGRSSSVIAREIRVRASGRGRRG